MANRIPLVIQAQKMREIANGDTLDLTGNPLIVGGNLTPSYDSAYSLGTASLKFTELHLSDASIVGGVFSGTATNATNSTTVTLVATNSTDASHYITFVDAATGDENIRTDTSLTYNPSSDTLTLGTLSGGNITSSNFSSSVELIIYDSAGSAVKTLYGTSS
jgi:hypothetical protein